MAKSKKIRKYIELKKQADRAEKTWRTLKRKEHNAFDDLSGPEVREYQRMMREEQDGPTDD